MSESYRYPGAQSFQRKDVDLFFGREEDEEALLRMIQLKQITVLHGKSGLGKTSLINAGLIPLLSNNSSTEEDPEMDEENEEVNTTIFEVRFGYHVEEAQPSPLDLLDTKIKKDQDIHSLLSDISNDTDELWFYLKSKQLEAETPIQFLIVFDQFEEFFTYPAEQVSKFKEAFAKLLNNKVPPHFQKLLRNRLRENPKSISSEDRKKLNTPISIKVMFSIRSDRLSLIDQLATHLPNVLVNLYELKPLDQTRARKAIVNPAALEIGNFRSKSFQYDETVLETIIKHLSDDNGTVEPFQIQYICEFAERLAIKDGKRKFYENDFGGAEGIQRIFNNFYEDQILELDNEDQLKTRIFIENELIHEGKRVFILESKAKELVSKTIINKLIAGRLLRRETTHLGEVIEISHDTLLDPIRKSQIERNQKLEEKEKKEKATKTLINRFLIVLILLFSAMFSVLVYFVGSIISDYTEMERGVLENWVEAMYQINNLNDIDSVAQDYTLATNILQSNNTIPVIIVYESGDIYEGVNFGEELDFDQNFLRQKVDQRVQDGFEPLEGYASSIYYFDSQAITRLRYFPFIIFIMILALIVGFYLFVRYVYNNR